MPTGSVYESNENKWNRQPEAILSGFVVPFDADAREKPRRQSRYVTEGDFSDFMGALYE